MIHSLLTTDELAAVERLRKAVRRYQHGCQVLATWIEIRSHCDTEANWPEVFANCRTWEANAKTTGKELIEVATDLARNELIGPRWGQKTKDEEWVEPIEEKIVRAASNPTTVIDSLPAEPLFTIPPLKWDYSPNGSWFADSPQVNYIVGERDGIVWLFVSGEDTPQKFVSIKEAQQAAEADYRERMAKGLTEWKPQ